MPRNDFAVQEQVLIEEALAAFTRTVDLKARLITKGAARHQRDTARVVAITTTDGEVRFTVEAKTVDREEAVTLARNRIKQFLNPGLLIVPYMTPRLAEFCREAEMPFLDTAGNMFIRGVGLYLFIVGRKPPQKLRMLQPQNRVHNPPALKVIFALLTEPRLAQATYRNIQEATGVALGTVVNTLAVLGRMGGLRETRNPRKRIWDLKKLVDLWVANYPLKLRINCLINRYRATDPQRLRNAEVTKFGAQWGGEVAAAKLTNYLEPATYTLYLCEPPARLIAACRLHPDPNGDVELLTAFWQGNAALTEAGGNGQLVPALLIYADMITIGGGRTAEVAQKVYNEHLLPTLTQN